MSLDIYLLGDYCEHCGRGDKVFKANITHNLGEMAKAAKIYDIMWRPDEVGFKFARHIIGDLKNGLFRLEKYPSKYKALNPSNGWGSYEGLLQVVRDYVEACEKYPDAAIEVSR